MNENSIDFKNQVKYKLGSPSAVEYKNKDGTFEILCNFTRRDISIGSGKTREEAWEDAYCKLVNTNN